MVNIKDILKERVLVLDGAMGTMIQKLSLTESDFRGEEFRDWNVNLKGCNDILSITQPDKIKRIHIEYLEAGADIIETNSFNSTSVSLADYDLAGYAARINYCSAMIAREAADLFNLNDPSKPRFVAGSIGPTNRTASISPDVSSPAERNITFDELAEAYYVQTKALIDGGVDLLLIETIFDTLNAKAAIFGAEKAIAETRPVPIMLSLTVSDKSGRTLSGQTIEAFLASVMHADVLSVGLNCSFGATDMLPFLRELGEKSVNFISAYPNAGLPNRFGEYDETPQTMRDNVKAFTDESLVNILGGCCGTTPEHISEICRLAETAKPHQISNPEQGSVLSGLEVLHINSSNNFLNIGERCNVAGSRKFLRLIKEKKYDEALEIARAQVEAGAQVIDINMDDAMLEAEQEMVTFLNLIASDPDICKVPLMIDSSKFNVIESGLKCVQGKPVVNSISLKEGEDSFLEKAALIKKMGAAVVVMAFDEIGQADTFERKKEICERAYNLLTQRIDFNPHDIIFDPNVLAIATGIKEHNNYARDFIEATRWIKANLPHAMISGGISNLSFSFRGNNYLREVMHSVFLYHAIKAGMDMGIVNPSSSIDYQDIPADLLTLVEDVVLNRDEDATERLIDIAHELKEKETSKGPSKADDLEGKSIEEKIIFALRKGITENLDTYISEALQKYDRAVDIIDGPLMQAMNEVGRLFGEGKMFLPQVVKSARTMKKAVELLTPTIEAQKESASTTKAGKFVIATVKGDVHDIGKNIVGIILACNNYEVIDLGVMVPTEEIIKAAIEFKADFVGLSGLITPSLEEMCNVAKDMERKGLNIPLMIGGATTSELHTAVKIAPNYSGPVFHLKDAAQNPIVAARLQNPSTKEEAVNELKTYQEDLRESLKEKKCISIEDARRRAFKSAPETQMIGAPLTPGRTLIENIPVSEIRSFINWKYFFNAWKVSGSFPFSEEFLSDNSKFESWIVTVPTDKRDKALHAFNLYRDANKMLDELNLTMNCIVGLYNAYSENDSIFIQTGNETFEIPTLRQQSDTPVSLSLSDFIAPKGKGDHIGTFAVAIGPEYTAYLKEFNKSGDDYDSILLQTLGDRLAEATSEWLHKKVRQELWGYEKEEIKTGDHQGIRPAVGYPSLPDMSLNFILDGILDFKSIGISMTEHGAMSPSSSVSGIYIAHPESSYFMLGDIDNDQMHEYADKRGVNTDEILKYTSKV